MRTLLTIGMAAWLATACAQAPSEHLAPATFQTELERGKAVLIDVRTPEEYAKGHLAGARNIDWNNEDLIAAVKELDRSGPVLLYCAAGGRSEEALHAMQREGFTDVHDLAGGIHAWKAQGLPLSTK